MSYNINFIVHSFDKNYRGGVLRVISLLSNAFIKTGMNVSIYSLSAVSEPAFELNRKVKLITLKLPIYETTKLSLIQKVLWIYKSYLRIKPYFQNKHNEIWITSSPLLSIIFSFFGKNKNIIIGCDHTSTYYINNKPFSWLRNKLIRRLNINIALTKEDGDYFYSKNINYCIIPNPIEKFYPIPKVNNNILYIGRFSKEKQPLEALKIFNQSRLWKKNFHFKMYGSGDLKNHLSEYIKENNLSNFVTIIENENNLQVMFENARCLVVTSKVEGFSLNILEAFSFGIPCFSYDCPYGPRNQIQNNINGYLIEQNNTDQFIDVLKRINDFPISEEVQLSVKYLLIDNIIPQWIKLFEKLTLQHFDHQK